MKKVTDQAEIYTLDDLQQIKALADPLRQRILGAFVAEPRTTKQVAEVLGQPPTKLYHHVDLLERVGLIRLVHTQPKRGTTEKYFQAIAQRFSIAGDSLGAEAASVIEEMFSKAFSEAMAEVRRVDPAEAAAKTILASGLLKVSQENLLELKQRIADLGQGLGEGGETETYRLLVAVYPSRDAEG